MSHSYVILVTNLIRFFTFAAGIMMEIVKSLIVFAHLIACCVAVGLVCYLDISLFHARRREFNKKLLQDMKILPNFVRDALIALWVTGFAIIALGIQMKGWAYIDNPKLWVKILVVMILTINGWLLHKYGLPMMERTQQLSHLSRNERSHLAIMGGISTASWLMAAYLGIARFMNGTLEFSTVLAIYMIVVAIAITVAWIALVFDIERRQRRLAPHIKAMANHLSVGDHSIIR